MSGSVTSSAGSFTALDGLSIAYTLHTMSRPGGPPARPRIAEKILALMERSRDI